jgi:general stress protein 26
MFIKDILINWLTKFKREEGVFMENIKERALKVANKRIAFVGSVNENNVPNIKAMSVAKHHGLEIFYFISSHSAVKTEHYKRNFNACLYFNDGLLYKELVLEGIMKIFNDIDIKKSIWKSNYKSAFKNGGIDDPDYCVLKFIAKKGRYHTEAFEIE